MEVFQLRVFLAVAEELHFSRAAEKLHLAQPPVSRTIKQLERELGALLFHRSTRSVSLTTSGEALIGPAREVLNSLRQAEAAVRSANDGKVGVVRIAFAGASTHRIVSQLARAVRAKRPGIRLELSSQNFAQPAMKRLIQGETDLALGRWDVIPPNVEARVVEHDRLVIALPRTHPMAGAERLSMVDLRTDPFVSLPPHGGAVLPDRLHHLARAGRFVADVVQIAPDTQTALALVSAEVGCHLTLASVARNMNDPHIVFVELDEHVTDVDLRIAWLPAAHSPAFRAVLAEVLTLGTRE